MKIVENSQWLFDEFIVKVEDKFPEPFHKTINYLADTYAPGVIEDLYEVWYYYINSPVMRYVNNYYEYEKYDPKVFKKNMFRAIHYLCNLEQERLVKMTREMMTDLSDFAEENPILDADLNRYEIYFVWVAEPGACHICRGLDGRILENSSQFVTHWNCRCHLERHIRLLSPEGEVINDEVKSL